MAKKIFIILLNISIIGILIFLYIDNINMDYNYYITYPDLNTNYYLFENEVYLKQSSLDNEVNIMSEYTQDKLSNLQKRNNILYTFLLILSFVDLILILTSKFHNNSFYKNAKLKNNKPMD